MWDLSILDLDEVQKTTPCKNNFMVATHATSNPIIFSALVRPDCDSEVNRANGGKAYAKSELSVKPAAEAFAG